MIRTIFFWTHLVVGIAASLLVLLMSVTGVLLTYERQLIEWSDRPYQSVPAGASAARIPVEELLTAAAAQRPETPPTSITIRSDAAAPATVAFGRASVYQDVHTGRLLGVPSTGMREAMSTLRVWHRWIGMTGEKLALGKAINGWANLGFLFLVLSGLYLWIPRRWTRQSVRAVTLFRGGLRGKARDFNWHNVFGLWSAIPLAIVVATAAPMSFDWANTLVYRLAGDRPPVAAGAGGGSRPSGGGGGGAKSAANQREASSRTDVGPFEGLNGGWVRAEQQVPKWRSIALRLPASSDGPLVFSIDRGTGGQPQHRGSLTVERATGDIVRWEPFETLSPGRRLRSWTRFAHTGEYYGLTGQTIAGLASAGAVMLVVTGLMLSWRRFFGKTSTASAGRSSARPEKAA